VVVGEWNVLRADAEPRERRGKRCWIAQAGYGEPAVATERGGRQRASAGEGPRGTRAVPGLSNRKRRVVAPERCGLGLLLDGGGTVRVREDSSMRAPRGAHRLSQE